MSIALTSSQDQVLGGDAGAGAAWGLDFQRRGGEFFPLGHRCEPRAHASIRTGDVVALDPVAGTVAVWRGQQQGAEAGSSQ